MRLLVFYHLYPANTQYVNNFYYFLKTSYVETVDYRVIIAGESNIELPSAPNIKYIFTHNVNYDYGGYGSAINSIKMILSEYDYFFFINSSVRGPFFNDKGGFWFVKFLEQFEAGHSLVGSTVNILESGSLIPEILKKYPYFSFPYTHIQSTAYALNQLAMELLLSIGFYDNYLIDMSKEEVIINYEVRLTQELLNYGFSVKSLLLKYDGIDFRKKHYDLNFSSKNGDPSFRGAYFGKTIDPFESVFIKTNRNIYDPIKIFKMSISNIKINHSKFDLKLNKLSLERRLLIETIFSYFIYIKRVFYYIQSQLR